MSTEVDLRDRDRDHLFETLDDVDAGEEAVVVADSDVEHLLPQYQLRRGRALSWSYDSESGPREIRVEVGGELDGHPAFDVREMPPQRRHSVLQSTFEALSPEDGFVLVNDHDPKPLSYEFRSMYGDTFEWEYEREGGDEWRVRIVKTEESAAAAEDVRTTFDVREVPKRERHPAIHHRYGTLPEGESMDIIAPHEPRPLRQEFRQQYGDTFSWEIQEQERGRCRVRITKEAAPDDESATAETEATAESAEEPGESAADLELVEELDVRDRPPAERHERIFAAFDDLDPGEEFVLVNDHDPKPLYHQFEAEAGDAFTWEYRKRDPNEFRVAVGKTDAVPSDASEESGDDLEAPF